MKKTNRKVIAALRYAVILTKIKLLLGAWADTILSVLVSFMVAEAKELPEGCRGIVSLFVGEYEFLTFILTMLLSITLCVLIAEMGMFVLMPNPYGRNEGKDKWKDSAIWGLVKFFVTASVNTVAIMVGFDGWVSYILPFLLDGLKNSISKEVESENPETATESAAE